MSATLPSWVVMLLLLTWLGLATLSIVYGVKNLLEARADMKALRLKGVNGIREQVARGEVEGQVARVIAKIATWGVIAALVGSYVRSLLAGRTEPIGPEGWLLIICLSVMLSALTWNSWRSIQIRDAVGKAIDRQLEEGTQDDDETPTTKEDQ